MTTLLIKHPKTGGMYEMVPTTDFLNFPFSGRMALSGVSSDEKTTLIPFLMPDFASLERTTFASLQVCVLEISVICTF